MAIPILISRASSLINSNLFVSKKEKSLWQEKLKKMDEVELKGCISIFEKNQKTLKTAIENGLKNDASGEIIKSLKILKRIKKSEVVSRLETQESDKAEDILKQL